jgi:hypothetical protein
MRARFRLADIPAIIMYVLGRPSRAAGHRAAGGLGEAQPDPGQPPPLRKGRPWSAFSGTSRYASRRWAITPIQPLCAQAAAGGRVGTQVARGGDCIWTSASRRGRRGRDIASRRASKSSVASRPHAIGRARPVSGAARYCAPRGALVCFLRRARTSHTCVFQIARGRRAVCRVLGMLLPESILDQGGWNNRRPDIARSDPDSYHLIRSGRSPGECRSGSST